MSATRKAIEQVNKYALELKKAEQELSKLKKGTREYNAAMKRHEAAYTKGKVATRELRTELNKLSTNFKSHRQLILQGGEAMNGFARSSQRAAKTTGGIAGGMKGAIKTVLKYSAAFKLINFALQTYRFFTTGAIQAGAEFEKNIANLSAVAGVSGRSLNDLREAALNVAGQTKFTANEIVGLQTELSKLGFSADDVVAATSSIAFGAQALGEPLDQVASQVGKIINQFNLLAEESGIVVDTIVTTINESALSMGSFATAIQYVGPLASGLGFSLQETAGAMAVLADNGFTASRIGTGLRGIFTELGTETVDLKSRLRELSEENLSLSEAVDLVGKRNAAQLITLVDNISVLDESEQRYYKQGRALESAAIQADTFSGQMDILKSAINEYQISIGNAIIETDFFQRVLSAISPSAGKTAAAFRLIKETGFEGVGEDIEKVVNDFDAFRVAVERAATEYEMTIEEVEEEVRKNQDRTVYNRQQGFNQTVRGYSKIGQAVEGYQKKLLELAAEEERNLLVQKERNKVQEQYQPIIDKLVVREQLGDDITDDADALATEVRKRMQGIVEEVKVWEQAITDASNDQERERLKNLKLAEEAKLKELSNYYRLLANLIGVEIEGNKEADTIVRRRAEQFKDLIDSYDDYKKSIKDTNDILELQNEAEENFIENTNARIRLNKELQDSNTELIGQLENEIRVRREAIDAEDQSTKQGAYNISMYNREIEALEKLIQKYYDQNEALNANADTIRFAQSNFNKALKELERDYDKGDIGTKAFTERREQLLNDFRAQLTAIAAGNPEMEKAVDALFGKIQGDMEGPINWRELLADGLDEAISTVSGIIDTFGDTAFNNLKNRLEAEKELLKDRYETEDYLAKQQFENGLINESQYRRRQQQLRKRQVEEENAIDKKLFEAQNQRDKNKARTDYLESLASIVPELIKAGKVIPLDLAITSAITATLATASYTSELSAINQRQFIPKKFAQGGMVQGPSHAEGGIPFTVRGQSGYEMEGGEFIVNKRASSLHRELLERINNSTKFANGGVVNKTVTRNDSVAESVNYLKAIAEATTKNAINSSKPVRAFVTSADLRSDETARRIKDNNTII